MSLKRLSVGFASLLAFSSPAFADPSFGLGLTITFGSKGADYGLSARVFSNDRKDQGAASAGVDYMFNSQSWRAALGAAYMMDDGYVDVTAGYNFTLQDFDIGLGLGGAKTRSPSSRRNVNEIENGTGEEILQ